MPLYKVVNAAIVDSYEDIGKVQQLYSHWAARGYKKLNNETLHSGIRRVLLKINHSTNTATLPVDFKGERFVGIINEYGQKVPFKPAANLVNDKSIEDIDCVDKCEKCNQDKSICSELTVTEDTVLVTINDAVYEQTIIKKLYPDGSYYLETKIPVWDYDSEAVTYVINKEYITSIDLKPCGCIDNTESNVEKLKCYCYDIYCKYYTQCCAPDIDMGVYRIFEEVGVVQLSKDIPYDKLYLEYDGFLPKKNGQYQIPEVAFETLVEWVKFKAVDGKKNISTTEKQWRFERYKLERSNMEKVRLKIPLSLIINAATLIPKFDVGYAFDLMHTCPTGTTIRQSVSAISQTVTTETGSSSSSSSSSSTDDCGNAAPAVCPCPSKGLVPFTLAVISSNAQGVPQPDSTTYQNNALIGAIGLDTIVVNNANETEIKGDFTFDSVTGTINRSPNIWFAGDVLVAKFSKFI